MKINVILPIYKPNQWILEALDSVFKQTYSHWDLIIVDDCTPQPGEIISHIKKMVDNNKNISYIRLNQNRGAATARNTGAANSSGDAIAFLDQDDKWHPKKLEEVVKYFESNPEVKLVHSNIEGIDSNSNLIPNIFDEENARREKILYSHMESEELSKELFKRYSLRLGTIVVKREEFEKAEGFDGSLFGGEDEEFAVRFAANFKIGHLSKKLTYRRIHSKNLSKTHNKERTFGELKAVDKMRKKYPYLGTLVRKKYAALMRRVVKLELNDKNRKKAQSYAQTLIKLTPVDPRAYLLWMLSFPGINSKLIFKYYRKLMRILS